jgi:hypothetical protein
MHVFFGDGDMLSFKDMELNIGLSLSALEKNRLDMVLTAKSIGYNIRFARMVADLIVVIVE